MVRSSRQHINPLKKIYCISICRLWAIHDFFPNMLNRHINYIQKWYITCITAPLGTAHHAATTQPIPFIQIAIAVGLRTTPKWKCRRSDKTHVSPKRRHPRPELISLQASLSSLVGNDIIPIAPLHTFQSRLFYFNYSLFNETVNPRTRPRQEISWNRGKFRAGPP